MNTLKIIAFLTVAIYCVAIVLLYAMQTKLIFHPGKLAQAFKFKADFHAEEVFLETRDGERINALFFPGTRKDVILYFHGNAGDLSGWQFVAEDFTVLGCNVMIIDYRGYGKSSGVITENGLYMDAVAGFNGLIAKGFEPQNIILYGRSVGCGVAVDLASKQICKGLILEAPFSSLLTLSNEKLPLFFPSLFIKFKFDNFQKINKVRCPVAFIHGSEDSLIPVKHTEKLFHKFTGKKTKTIIPAASHNDLNQFPGYHQFLRNTILHFF